MAQNGLQSSMNRINFLADNVIEFQIRLIYGACKAKRLKAKPEMNKDLPCYSTDTITHKNLKDNVYNSIENILKSLMHSSITDDKGEIEWLGMEFGPDGKSFYFGPIGTQGQWA